MRLSTAEEMMNSDKKMAEDYGVPTLILMEHASLCLLAEMEKRNLLSGKMVIVCGKGNNGGDGYALARHLSRRGCDVSIINAFSMVPGSPDAATNYKICRNLGIRFADVKALKDADVIVDALFGIGMNNRLNDFCADIINRINETDAFVVSVDLPSGAYGDNTLQKNPCVKADLTVTFASYKPALVFYPSAYCCGEVVCCDIGINDDCFGGNAYIIDNEYLRKNLPERKKHGHKGSFGRVLGIGGSVGLSGAVFMSGQAAMHSGCGTVKLCIPECISKIMEIKTTEVMTVSCPDNGNGQLSETGIGEIIKNTIDADALIFGCGMGRFPEAALILERVLVAVNIPVIIDADGIYALSRNIDMLRLAECPVILTPHLGEMSALTGISIEQLEADPIGSARKFAKEYGVILCLKSSRTIIAMPDGTVYANIYGNSGMAKGGSGDVLSGIIASLAAQGAKPPSAAVCGVGIHALAGDVAADIKGEYSMAPVDIIENIGAVIDRIL